MTHTHHLNAPLRTTRQSAHRCSSSWAKPELRGLPCVICERQKREGKGGMRVENVSVRGMVCVVCAYQLRSILPPHCLLLLPRCSHRKNPSRTSQPAASNRIGVSCAGRTTSEPFDAFCAWRAAGRRTHSTMAAHAVR